MTYFRLLSAAKAAVFGSILAFVGAPALADDYPNELAADEDATVLQPISPWNIDFAEDTCRLTRVFGSEDEMHLLYFEQAAPSPTFGVTFAGDAISRYQTQRRLYIGMQRDEEMKKLERISIGDIESVGPAVIITSFSIGGEVPEGTPRLAGIDLTEAEKVDRIVLKRGRRVLSFETGNMMPPFQAMNTCTSDLLRDWGLDPDQHASYTPPVFTNEADFARRVQSTYPRAALNRGEQGIFRMRVIVEADGSVSDCNVHNSTVSEHLETSACRQIGIAEFEPARGADGAPIRSFYATSITYAIN